MYCTTTALAFSLLHNSRFFFHLGDLDGGCNMHVSEKLWHGDTRAYFVVICCEES